MDNWIEHSPPGRLIYGSHIESDFGMPVTSLNSTTIINALILSAILWSGIVYLAFSIKF